MKFIASKVNGKVVRLALVDSEGNVRADWTAPTRTDAREAWLFNPNISSDRRKGPHIPDDVRVKGMTLQVYEFISSYLGRKGYSPSIREIPDDCVLGSTSVVMYHLRKLQQAGLITRVRGVARQIKLTEVTP